MANKPGIDPTAIKINDKTVSAKDPGQTKNFDSTSGKILNASGEVISDTHAVRNDLVENLVTLLQNTIESKISGITFNSKIDLIENYLFDLKTYADSLKEASNTIAQDYPSVKYPDSNDSLAEISDICDVITEGINRVNEYTSAIKTFGNDLNNIKTALYTHIQTLHTEL